MSFQTINVTVSSIKALTSDIREVKVIIERRPDVALSMDRAHTMLFIRDRTVFYWFAIIR